MLIRVFLPQGEIRGRTKASVSVCLSIRVPKYGLTAKHGGVTSAKCSILLHPLKYWNSAHSRAMQQEAVITQNQALQTFTLCKRTATAACTCIRRGRRGFSLSFHVCHCADMNWGNQLSYFQSAPSPLPVASHGLISKLQQKLTQAHSQNDRVYVCMCIHESLVWRPE